jgi:hypothetical protein
MSDDERRWIERRDLWTGPGISTDRRSGRDRRTTPRDTPDRRRRDSGERRVSRRRSGPTDPPAPPTTPP